MRSTSTRERRRISTSSGTSNRTPLEGPRRIDQASVEPRKARSEAEESTVDYHFPDPGEPLLGHVSGVRKRELRQLRAGKVACERVVDLHGQRQDAARRRLSEELFDARDAGEHCVLVIHGRGSHSARGAPVLRQALPRWLTTAPLCNIVRAFAPAQLRDGGAGASYVLLA